MIINNLYSTVLLEPVLNASANEVFIVSGYASATFARRHIKELVDSGVKVHLIIGMPTQKNDHGAYLQLHEEFGENFKGYYLDSGTPVHSKIYSWFLNGKPVQGFSGSANYSQYGFFTEKQVNQMAEDDPAELKFFFDELLARSISIPEAHVATRTPIRLPVVAGSVPAGQIEWLIKDKAVRVSFLDRSGEVPAVSGLNWGQREGREKNQAYLSIKGDAREEGFLPERGFTFTLVTDDNVVMDCVVAQDGRKAIQSTKDNSELGRYIRNRIGVEPGAFVTVQNLEQYGRTDFTLIKIDDENFQLDFSVSR